MSKQRDLFNASVKANPNQPVYMWCGTPADDLPDLCESCGYGKECDVHLTARKMNRQKDTDIENIEMKDSVKKKLQQDKVFVARCRGYKWKNTVGFKE